MAITEQDIRRLRREAEKDLEALARVEAILLRRNGAIPQTTPGGGKERGQLKQLTIEVLKAAGADGMRPNMVLRGVRERGYKFKTDRTASASISTALSRLVEAKRVEKKDGKYGWKEETGKD